MEYIERKFEEFNARMFGGKLPKLPFVLSDAARSLGHVSYRKNHRPDGSICFTDFVMHINTRADLPEDVVEDTIIHEMIHYFIFYHNLIDTSAHGDIFRSIMNSINATYGRHITVSFKDKSPETRQQFVDKRAKWHIIAAIDMSGGKKYVKVLPRIQERIIAFDATVKRIRGFVRVSYFMHDNPFFNAYPVSTALRIFPIEPAKLDENLKGARIVKVTPTQVIVT